MIKSFGDVNVIKFFDLYICDGEFIVFVGLLGCGKLMLFCMIVGFEDIISGCIEIDN